MHTYLPCVECTITLEDVQLQLGLPVDGPVMTGSVQANNWRDVRKKLLGKVSKTICGARIDMNWLRKNFGQLNEDSTQVQREQQARVYILLIIKGVLMPDKSRNLVHLRWLLKHVNFREAGKLSWWLAVLRCCTGGCVGQQNHEKFKLVVACYYFNHRCGTDCHFYVLKRTILIHFHS